MPDLLLQGVAWLHQFRKQNLVESVDVDQDGVLYSGIDMTVGREESIAAELLGAAILDARSQDFIAEPKDFAARGMREPERGDKIYRNVEGMRIEYEVMPDGDEPHFRPVSRYRLAWRIHTKRTDLTAIAP